MTANARRNALRTLEIQKGLDVSYNPVLGLHVARATADIITGTTVGVFTIAGGRVLLMGFLGQVTTIIGAGASNQKFVSNPTTGTTTDLCANLDIDADEAGTLYSITGIPTDALQRSESGSMRMLSAAPNGIVLPVGQIESVNGTNRSGSIKLDAWYFPLDDGATLVAA